MVFYILTFDMREIAKKTILEKYGTGNDFKTRLEYFARIFSR